MSTFLAFSVLTILFVAVFLLLERNHRKTDGLPHAPFGADLEHEADLARIRHELGLS